MMSTSEPVHFGALWRGRASGATTPCRRQPFAEGGGQASIPELIVAVSVGSRPIQGVMAR
jgi:hypothetical protein